MPDVPVLQEIVDRQGFLLALRYKGRYSLSIRMATLNRNKNGGYVSRKAIPADVRDAYTLRFRSASKATLRVTRAGQPPTAPKVWEELFKAPAFTSPATARVLWAEWSAEIDTRVSSLRAEAVGKGQALTRRNALALAGRWYRWFIELHSNDLNGPKHWERVREHIRWDVIGREAPDDFLADTGADPHWEWAKDSQVRERVRPVIAEIAKVASFLASAGLSLNTDAFNLFVDEVSELTHEAMSVLEQRADGDYTPDETPKRFPAFVDGRASAVDGLSCWGLFEAWVAAAKRAGSSVRRGRGVFLAMQAQFSNTSAGALTARDAKTWIDSLITKERSAFTVANVWLSVSRSVFNWGVEQERVSTNPFSGVKVTVERRTRERATKTFTAIEAKTILEASQRLGVLRTPMDRAKRWVPLLCAYTGARSGEMTQLRKTDVFQSGGEHYARLAPSAGTIKSGKARTVPLHEHLVELGFIDFVGACESGPMFYKPPAASRSPVDPNNPRRGPAVKTRESLGEWVRSLGITDPDLSPSHAWRHTFLAKARQAGIERSLRFAITGHEEGTIGDAYGQPEPEELAEALKKFPRYDFVTRVDGE